MGIMKHIADFLRKLDGDQPTKPAVPQPKKSGMLDYADLIREHEGKERNVYDRLADQRKEIARKEAELKRLFAEYDQASPSMKSSYEVEIRSLDKDLENLKKDLKTFAFQLEQEKVILQKLRHLRNTGDHEIDEMEIQKIIRAAAKDVDEQERKQELLDELESVQYPEYREDQADTEQNEAENREDFRRIRAKVVPEQTKKKTPEKPEESSSEIEDIKKKINSL